MHAEQVESASRKMRGNAHDEVPFIGPVRPIMYYQVPNKRGDPNNQGFGKASES